MGGGRSVVTVHFEALLNSTHFPKKVAVAGSLAVGVYVSRSNVQSCHPVASHLKKKN